MMPIKSTAPIRAFSPGLAKKATMICLYSTNRINEHSTRNTSIRTRKIRGDDSLVSSISIAERVLGAIGRESGLGRGPFRASIWHSDGGKTDSGRLFYRAVRSGCDGSGLTFG